MSTTVKRKDLLQWLATVFQEPVGAMDESRSRSSIPTWDSMGSLLLMAELDERVHVTLEEEELKKMTTIGDIFALLRQRQVVIEGE